MSKAATTPIYVIITRRYLKKTSALKFSSGCASFSITNCIIAHPLVTKTKQTSRPLLKSKNLAKRSAKKLLKNSPSSLANYRT